MIPWTVDQTKFLIENYNKMSKLDLSNLVGHSYSSVISKGNSIGISRKALNNPKIKSCFRFCVICKNQYPKTNEYFASYNNKKYGILFSNKCKPCERTYVQKIHSTPRNTFNLILRTIARDPKRTINGFDITLDYLLELWNKQDHKCAISGIEMTTLKGKGVYYFSNVTVDRIDSKLGYTKDNIQLVCSWANSAKSNLDSEKFKELIGLTYKKMMKS